MAESVPEGPTVPPPGQRSGAGSESLLPYLTRRGAAPLKDGTAPRNEGPDGGDRAAESPGR